MYCTGESVAKRLQPTCFTMGSKRFSPGRRRHPLCPASREQGIPANSRKNFVFDDRLGERITNDVIAHCHQWINPPILIPIAGTAPASPFIQCDECAEKWRTVVAKNARTLSTCRKRSKTKRTGAEKEHNIFNKSRQRLRPILRGRKLAPGEGSRTY